MQRIHFCTNSEGIRIAYATSGEGPVVVKTANYLSHLEFDWTSPIWRPWLQELSKYHHLVRYDERGCGLSDRTADDISLDGWIRDLEAVIDEIGLRKFTLLGTSQGGSIAIAYAVRHPDRVERLILYGAYGRGRLKRDPTPQQIAEAETMVKLAELGWGKDDPAFREVFTMQLLPEGTQEQHRWFNELQRMSASADMAARMMRVFDGLDVSSLAPKVKCPTLVLHARNDSRIPFEEGRRLAGLIPRSRFVPLEGRNHILLHGEPAWDQFMEEVRAFVLEDAKADPIRNSTAFYLLTRREMELLNLMAAGLSNDEIAARLGLSEKTVRNHVTSIFSKLHVTTRALAIVRAREAGYG